MTRRAILKHNQALREGRLPGPRRLDDGEVVFKIPHSDYRVLVRLYPDLASHDHKVKLKAWQDLRNSPVGQKYLVTRTPQQVKRSPAGIIIK